MLVRAGHVRLASKLESTYLMSEAPCDAGQRVGEEEWAVSVGMLSRSS